MTSGKKSAKQSDSNTAAETKAHGTSWGDLTMNGVEEMIMENLGLRQSIVSMAGICRTMTINAAELNSHLFDY